MQTNIQSLSWALWCILLLQVARNDKGWKAWFDTEAPEENPVPDGYNTLDTFRKLLLIRYAHAAKVHALMSRKTSAYSAIGRSWCPDRVLPQARKYISESMGVKYAEGVILNLEEMWQESTTRVPMICFLSMGSDPTNSIDTLARKHDLSENKTNSPQDKCVYMSSINLFLFQHLGPFLWDRVKKCMQED